MFEHLLAALGLTKGATLGGFLGAVVSLKFIENMTWVQRVPTVFGGMLCAAYVTPLVAEMAMHSPTARTESAIAFLIGMFGMSIAAAIVKAMPELIAAVKDRIKGSR